MRETFNGDLFPPPPKDEGPSDLEGTLTAAQLEIPRSILARTDLTTFQQSLNFWRYEFDVIPIELVSSIYEQFIHAADPETAEKGGNSLHPRESRLTSSSRRSLTIATSRPRSFRRTPKSWTCRAVPVCS